MLSQFGIEIRSKPFSATNKSNFCRAIIEEMRTVNESALNGHVLAQYYGFGLGSLLSAFVFEKTLFDFRLARKKLLAAIVFSHFCEVG